MKAHHNYNQVRFSDLAQIKKDDLLDGLQDLKHSLRDGLDANL
jgi:hypothetical protein